MSLQSGTSPGAISSSGTSSSGGAAVTSVFGRAGIVVAVPGDYNSDQITNASGVAGATVSDALETLATDIANLDSSDIANVSTVPGATVTNALDRLSSTAVPLSITAPADVTKSAAVVGVGTTAARADHKHDITTAAAVSVATTNTEGTATTLARSDHTHAGVTSAFGRNGVVVAVVGDYTSSQVSNASTVPGATVTNALDSLSSTAVPLAITAPADVTKSAAVVGVGTTAARADHKHDITTAAAVSVATTNTEGTATTLARSDHTHAGVTSAFGRNGVVVAVSGDYTSSQVSNASTVTGATVTDALNNTAALTAAAPADVTKSAAVVGVGTTAARSDHKHDITTAAAVTIGTANTEGTATTLSRSDHVHNHGAQTDGTLHAVATTSVAGFESAADKTKLDLLPATGAYNWTWADAQTRTAQSVTSVSVGLVGWQTDMELAFQLTPGLTWARLEDPRCGPFRGVATRNNFAGVPTIQGSAGLGVFSGTAAARQASSGTNAATRRIRNGWTGTGAGSVVEFAFESTAATNNSLVPSCGFRSRTTVVIATITGASRWCLAGYISSVPAGDLDPNTFLDFVGIGRGSANANVQLYNNDGSGVATQTDLGSGFPANTAAEGYELEVFTKTGASWIAQITNVNTRGAASFTLSANLPSTLQGGPLVYMTNHTDAGAFGIDLAAMETRQWSWGP